MMMDIRYTIHTYSQQHRRYRQILRRLMTDVLPTLLLLLAMALGMSLVARYAESSHFKPVFTCNQTLQQLSD